MSEKIRVAIVGYGNLGRGVESALLQNDDMCCAGVFTRREPSEVALQGSDTKAYRIADIASMKAQIDVVILCGGSATDLPVMTPQLAADFTVVDSFDNHSKIPEHFAAVDAQARKAGTLAMISVGWDPGLFSLNRAIGEAVLPKGTAYTFWGRGVSQGHSDAVRRIAGVVDARQYTIPVPDALEAVRSGQTPQLSTREKHTRLVYVVAAEGATDADKARIEREIVTMPGYFDDYDTTVNFISAATMQAEHSGLPHGGSVFRSGKTGPDESQTQVIEYRLALESNPQFTSSVLVAYARAAHRMHKEGQVGCRTVFDVAPAYLLNKTAEDMRRELL